jgi:hypothetical protein
VGGKGVLEFEQDLTLTRQVLYHLSHSASPKMIFLIAVIFTP